MNKDSRVIYRDCVECGEEFAIGTNFQRVAEENGLKLPKRCPSCREERKLNNVEVKCIEPECGAKFTITASESKYYKERGLHEPRRCPSCREKRKHGKRKE